jgi:thymidine kinase
MIDTMTNNPIRVRVHEDVQPFIKLPKDQVDAVSRLLESNGIQFWVAHISISFNGEPYVSTIHLRWGMNPEKVQAILDSVP